MRQSLHSKYIITEERKRRAKNTSLVLEIGMTLEQKRKLAEGTEV